jgi:hypothetical protein
VRISPAVGASVWKLSPVAKDAIGASSMSVVNFAMFIGRLY